MTARTGIVLVSHSAALAEGAAELAGQGAGEAVVIATAGDRLGTSAEKMSEAIRRACTGAGVLAISDLGDVGLTVKGLLTDIEDEDGGAAAFGPLGPVEIADALFVEGAVAAAKFQSAIRVLSSGRQERPRRHATRRQRGDDAHGSRAPARRPGGHRHPGRDPCRRHRRGITVGPPRERRPP